MVGASSTPFNNSSRGLVLTLSVTLWLVDWLSVTPFVVGGGWGGGGSTARQPVLGDGP